MHASATYATLACSTYESWFDRPAGFLTRDHAEFNRRLAHHGQIEN